MCDLIVQVDVGVKACNSIHWGLSRTDRYEEMTSTSRDRLGHQGQFLVVCSSLYMHMLFAVRKSVCVEECFSLWSLVTCVRMCVSVKMEEVM